jgi:hypothetical protein
MSAEDFYKQECPYNWDSDKQQTDEGFYGKEDMERFAEAYHQSKLKNNVALADVSGCVHPYNDVIQDDLGRVMCGKCDLMLSQ